MKCSPSQHANISKGGRNTDSEPRQVPDAYDKVELNILGYGTQLVSWHAKLGFQPSPALATLHALSPDGESYPANVFSYL